MTYKNLETWYDELQEHCKGIPTIVVANKIDVDYKVRVTRFLWSRLSVQNRILQIRAVLFILSLVDADQSALSGFIR